MLIILAVHSFVFNDYNVIISSDIYEQYKLIIIAFLSYTVYVLYSNNKKNHKIRSRYYLYFSVIILAVLPSAQLCHALYLPKGAGITNTAIAILNTNHTCSVVY